MPRSVASCCVLRTAFEDHERLSTCVAVHIDIAPAHRLANAGPEGFRDGFLGREARGEMARRKFHRLAIGDFAGSEDPMQEAFAKTLE